MPQKIFNPPPQSSKLGTLCPTIINFLLLVCLFVSLDGFFFSPPFYSSAI